MRLEQARTEISSSGTMEVAKATIKATPKIFSFFADQTYANKPVAILRELVANAVDAHTAVGTPERPVEIQLPTDLDPIFRVRDYGVGMSHEFVMGPFMAYTDGSTKDQSNDQIGGFGIGSKSPFAYVDQFTLRIVYNGVLSVYTMFKDEDGIPSIGLQGSKTTDEHNGVEVSFPVEGKDIGAFQEAAQTALQYRRPLPIVKNGTLTPPEYSHVGKDWALRPAAGDLYIIMGGIRYPVAEGSLSWSTRGNNKIAPLLKYGIDLTMPIGSVGVALSRESLSYDDRTDPAIVAALEGILADVISTFSTMFDGEPTLWKAAKKLAVETGMNGNGYNYNRSPRAVLIENNAIWNGTKLQTMISYQKRDDLFRLWNVEGKTKYRRGTSEIPKSAKWTKPSDSGGVSPNNVDFVIIDNLPNSPKSKTVERIRSYVQENSTRDKDSIVYRVADLLGPEDKDGMCVVLKDRTDQSRIDELIKLLGDPDNLVYTADMPEPVVIVNPKTQKIRPKVRMFTYNGEKEAFSYRQPSNLQPSYSKEGLVKEIAYEDQPTTGILVTMNSFDLPANFYSNMKAGLIEYSELYFCNVGDAAKLNDSFQSFEDAYAKRLTDALAKFPEAAQRKYVSERSALDRWEPIFQVWSPVTVAQKASPFGKLQALWLKYKQPVTAEERKLFEVVSAVQPKDYDPTLLQTQMKAKQPLLSTLLDVVNNERTLSTKEGLALLNAVL